VVLQGFRLNLCISNGRAHKSTPGPQYLQGFTAVLCESHIIYNISALKLFFYINLNDKHHSGHFNLGMLFCRGFGSICVYLMAGRTDPHLDLNICMGLGLFWATLISFNLAYKTQLRDLRDLRDLSLSAFSQARDPRDMQSYAFSQLRDRTPFGTIKLYKQKGWGRLPLHR
jgi:hypothetical protein